MGSVPRPSPPHVRFPLGRLNRWSRPWFHPVEATMQPEIGFRLASETYALHGVVSMWPKHRYSSASSPFQCMVHRQGFDQNQAQQLWGNFVHLDGQPRHSDVRNVVHLKPNYSLFQGLVHWPPRVQNHPRLQQFALSLNPVRRTYPILDLQAEPPTLAQASSKPLLVLLFVQMYAMP